MAIKALDGGMGGGAAPKLENFTVLPNNTPSVRFGTNISFKKDPMGEQMEKLIDTGVKVKVAIDDNDANDAATKYMQYCAEKSQKYQQMQNDAALKDADGNDVLTGFNEDREAYKSSLYENMSSEARAKFDERVAPTERHWTITTEGHQFDQFQAVDKRNTSSQIDGNYKQCIDYVDKQDWTGVDQSIEATYKAAYDYELRNGNSEEGAAYLAQIHVQNQVLGTYEYMKLNDATKASAFIDKYSYLVPSDKYEKLKEESAVFDGYQRGIEAFENAVKTHQITIGGGSSTVASNLDSFKGIIKDRIVRHESGGNWKKRNGAGSSASGLYQITDDNIRGINKKYGTHFTYADKMDSVKGEQIFQYVAKEHYEEAKKRTGRSSFSAGEVYQIWFLGPAGFAKMSKAAPNSLVTDNLVGDAKQQARIKAQNKSYLYTNNGKGRAMTVAEFRSFMDRKTSKGGTKQKVNMTGTTASEMIAFFRKTPEWQNAGYRKAIMEMAQEQGQTNQHNEQLRKMANADKLDAYSYETQKREHGNRITAGLIRLDGERHMDSSAQQQYFKETSAMSESDLDAFSGFLAADPNSLKAYSLNDIQALTGGGKTKLGRYIRNTWYRIHGVQNRYDAHMGSMSQSDINHLNYLIGTTSYPTKWSNVQKRLAGMTVSFAVDAMSTAKGREQYGSLKGAMDAFAEANYPEEFKDKW